MKSFAYVNYVSIQMTVNHVALLNCGVLIVLILIHQKKRK